MANETITIGSTLCPIHRFASSDAGEAWFRSFSPIVLPISPGCEVEKAHYEALTKGVLNGLRGKLQHSEVTFVLMRVRGNGIAYVYLLKSSGSEVVGVEVSSLFAPPPCASCARTEATPAEVTPEPAPPPPARSPRASMLN